jgi:hypothetical protein
MKRLVLAVVLVAAGCGDTINNTYVTSDGGVGTDANGTCTPNAKECVTDRVARICAADGSGWVSQQCDIGDICSGGDCSPDPNVACTPGVDGACLDATHGLVCNDNGMGFKTITCPANTGCAGPGICVGSCIVGESTCLDPNTVATCLDGVKLTTTSCSRGSTACVSTGTTPFQTAACKPADCEPGPQGCDTVCGNKTAGATNMDTGFESLCQETPNGYKWVALQCQAGTTCNPHGTVCGGGLYAASCQGECTPGDTRCNSNGDGVQVCGSNSTWGTITPCTATATGALQVCIQSLTGTGPAVCGDAVCGTDVGACEADGFHPCVNGKVSATGMACTKGACVATGSPANGLTPGQCTTQCKDGDQRCPDPIHVQTCMNGLWGSLTACSGANTCELYDDATSGRPRAVCGICVPGSHRCTNSSGTPTTPGTHIEVCSADGLMWGTQTACAVGQCRPNGNDFACVADCIPGAQFCVGGAPASPSNPQHPGQIAVVICTAGGTIPAAPTCPAGAGCCPSGTSCRQGPGMFGSPVVSGNTPAACVECVGPMITGGNENGLVDTKCVAGGTGSLQVCQNNNTWGASMSCTTSCAPEVGNIVPEVCGSFGGTPFSDSTIAALVGPGSDCTTVTPNGSAPCGGVADCCQVACTTDPASGFPLGAPVTPVPAHCQ